MDALRERWLELVTPFGAPVRLCEDAFADVAAHYGGAMRHYHNLDHVRDVLDAIGAILQCVAPPLALAGWLHDVIYDSRRPDNEQRSVDYAGAVLPALGVPADLGAEAARLILLTRWHEADPCDLFGTVLLDADLAILGAEPAVYDAYATAIRQEYAWVPEPEYRLGRAQVLQRFLARPRIYHTARMARQCAARAAVNLRRELLTLA